MRNKKARIVIVGGGGTGAATARDLALRGYKPLLIERDELCGGTTGRHHGQIHSGARYAVGDREIARECHRESMILRKIAAPLIEDNGGLFIACSPEEEAYAEQFQEACSEAGIENHRISGELARKIEPELSPSVRLAVKIPADASFDAWRLPAAFFASAMLNGAQIRRFCNIEEIEVRGSGSYKLKIYDKLLGKKITLDADAIINAAGPWAGKIAELSGLNLEMTQGPGTMIAVKKRLCQHIISRLRPPSDGDIIVPQRGFSIIGSTQWYANSPEDLTPPKRETDLLLSCGDAMLPAFSSQDLVARWSAARPLAERADEINDARSLSRDFSCRDHASSGAPGFFSLIGGKATVLRAMGELAAKTLSSYFGDFEPGRSATELLPPYRAVYQLLGDQEDTRRYQWEWL